MEHGKADSLNARQIGVAVFLTGIAGKLFAAPIGLATAAGRSAWAVLAVFLAADFLILVLYLWMSKKNQISDTAIFPLKKNDETIGISQKILAAVFGLFFFLKTVCFLFTVSDFADKELFGGVPALVTVLPIAVVLYLFGTGGFRSIGRTGEIFVWFAVLAAVMLLLLLNKSADMTKVMPPFGEGNFTRPLFRFPFLLCGDWLFLFFVPRGNRHKKGGTKGIVWAGIAAVLVVSAFSMLSFASIINLQAITPGDAVSVVTGTSTAKLGFGRVDKVAFAVLMLSAVLAAGFHFRACVQSAETLIGIKKKTAWLPLGLVILILIFAVLTGTERFLELAYLSGIYVIGVAVLAYFIFCAFVLTKKSKEGSGNEKRETNSNL